jgi:hypothetical protein
MNAAEKISAYLMTAKASLSTNTTTTPTKTTTTATLSSAVNEEEATNGVQAIAHEV